jgi:hypothetical protein
MMSTYHTILDQTFGGDRMDRGASILRTADGSTILTGHTQSGAAWSREVYLIDLADNDGRL